MQNKRAEIKAWLARTGRSYQNLADEMQVSLFTVNGWLSKNNIPKAKLERIEAMMKADTEPERGKAAHSKVSAEDFKTFPVLLANEDYERCLHAADAAGLSVSDWAADICAAEAAEFIKKEQQADVAATQSRATATV